MPGAPPVRVGFPLLPVPDDAGRLRWPEPVESIEQHVRVLLQTRPGEQLMHPRFGAGLQRFVGQPDTVSTRTALRQAIADALGRWETRILVEAVDLTSDPVRPGWLRVEIRFRVKRTGAPKQLGLDLRLAGA